MTTKYTIFSSENRKWPFRRSCRSFQCHCIFRETLSSISLLPHCCIHLRITYQHHRPSDFKYIVRNISWSCSVSMVPALPISISHSCATRGYCSRWYFLTLTRAMSRAISMPMCSTGQFTVWWSWKCNIGSQRHPVFMSRLSIRFPLTSTPPQKFYSKNRESYVNTKI